MSKYYLNFESQTEFLTACTNLADVIDGEEIIQWPEFTDVVTFDGFNQPTGELDENDEPIFIKHTGFFVNVLGTLPPELEAYQVTPSPKTPFFEWQGV